MNSPPTPSPAISPSHPTTERKSNKRSASPSPAAYQPTGACNVKPRWAPTPRPTPRTASTPATRRPPQRSNASWRRLSHRRSAGHGRSKCLPGLKGLKGRKGVWGVSELLKEVSDERGIHSPPLAQGVLVAIYTCFQGVTNGHFQTTYRSPLGTSWKC